MLAGVLELQLISDISRLSIDMRRAEEQVKNSTDKMGRSVATLESAFGKLGSTLSLGLAFEAVRRLSDDFTKLTAQVRIATKSQEEYAAGLAEVRRISTESQASITATGALYTRLTNSLGAYGATQKQVANITETVSLGLKAYGATSVEAASAMLQLSQAFASNRLGGDEFRAMMESMPNMMRTLATSMGVPFEALKNLSAEGKITAKEMMKAWDDPALIATLQKQANMTRTITGEITVLRNNIMMLVGELMQTSNGTQGITAVLHAMSDGVLELAKHIEGLATWATITAALFAGKYLMAIAAAKKMTYDHGVALAMNAKINLDAAEAERVALTVKVATAEAESRSLTGVMANTAATIKLAQATLQAAFAKNDLTIASLESLKAQLAHAQAAGVLSGHLYQQRVVEAELTAATATRTSLLARLVAMEESQAIATRAVTTAMLEEAYAMNLLFNNTARVATATEALAVAQVGALAKTFNYAKNLVGGTLGVIGLALWGAYEIADHLGWIDKVFNRAKSNMDALKGLAGDSPIFAKAFAYMEGEMAKYEANIKRVAAMKNLGVTVSVNATPTELIAAIDKALKDLDHAIIWGQTNRLEAAMQLKLLREGLEQPFKSAFDDKFSFSAAWLKDVEKYQTNAQKKAEIIVKINTQYGIEMAKLQQSVLDSSKKEELQKTLDAARNRMVAAEDTVAIARQVALNSEYNRLLDVIQKSKEKGDLTQSEISALNLVQKATKDATAEDVAQLAVQAQSAVVAQEKQKARDAEYNRLLDVIQKAKERGDVSQAEISALNLTQKATKDVTDEEVKRAAVLADFETGQKKLWEIQAAEMVKINAHGITQIDTLDKEIAAQKLHNDSIGMSAEAIAKLKAEAEALLIVKMENEAQDLSSADTSDAVAATKLANIQAEIVKMKELRDLKAAAAPLEAAKKLANEEKKAQEKLWHDIDRFAHTAFDNIFDKGKNVFEELGKVIQKSILDILYQMTVKKWILQVETSASGGGISSLTGGGGTSGMGSLFSAGSSLFGSSGTAAASSAGWTTAAGQVVGGYGAGAGVLAQGGGLTAEAAASTAAMAGGEAGAASAIGALSTAMPYIAAAYMAYSLLSGSKEGSASTTGYRASGSINAGGITGTGYSLASNGSSNFADLWPAGNLQQNAALGNVQGQYKALQDQARAIFTSLGATAGTISDMSIPFSISTGLVGAAGIGQAITQSMVDNFPQATIKALQQSALPDYLQKFFATLAPGLSSADANAALQFAQQIKSVRDSLLYSPLELAQSQVSDLTKALGTSADTFKTDFVAAIDAGINSTTLARWQSLGTAIDQVTKATTPLALNLQSSTNYFASKLEYDRLMGRIGSKSVAAPTSNDELIAEIKAMRAELAALRNSSDATAASTRKTTDLLRNVTRDGNSLLTTPA